MMEQGFPAAGSDAAYVATAGAQIFGGTLAIAAAFYLYVLFSQEEQKRDSAFWIVRIGRFLLVAVFVYIFFARVWGPVGNSLFANILAAFALLVSIGCSVLMWSRSRKRETQWFKSLLVKTLAVCIWCCAAFGLLSVPSESAAVIVRRMQCRSHLKGLLLAIHNYSYSENQLPNTAAGDPSISWRVLLLPYISEEEIFEQYDFSKSWNQAPNDQLMSQKIRSYDCPSRRITVPSGDPWPTAYIIPTGPGTLMQPTGKRQFEDATDGLSQTICLVEACGLEIPWTEPRDADISRQPIGVNLKGKGLTDSPGILSSWHGGVVHVGFADGSTRMVSQNIDPSVLKALLTADGGETIPANWNSR